MWWCVSVNCFFFSSSRYHDMCVCYYAIEFIIYLFIYLFMHLKWDRSSICKEKKPIWRNTVNLRINVSDDFDSFIQLKTVIFFCFTRCLSLHRTIMNFLIHMLNDNVMHAIQTGTFYSFHCKKIKRIIMRCENIEIDDKHNSSCDKFKKSR